MRLIKSHTIECIVLAEGTNYSTQKEISNGAQKLPYSPGACVRCSLWDCRASLFQVHQSRKTSKDGRGNALPWKYFHQATGWLLDDLCGGLFGEELLDT